MPTTKSLITVPCDRKCERIMLVRYSPPCGDARRGGCVINKMLRSHRSDAAGVVFLLFSIGKPPRPRDQRRLRDIFLIARPPLLAVMQGGECPPFQMIHSSYDRRQFSHLRDRRRSQTAAKIFLLYSRRGGLNVED